MTSSAPIRFNRAAVAAVSAWVGVLVLLWREVWGMKRTVDDVTSIPHIKFLFLGG